MNYIYDNGSLLLGTKKDIINYAKENIKYFKKVGDDYVIETNEEIIDELKEYDNLDDNTILSINYDSGMGYIIEYWQECDKVKGGN